MSKFPGFVFVFLWITFSSAAQQITLRASIGGGTYAMKDFKAFQTEIKNQFPVKATITNEFPPYLFFEASGLAHFAKSFFAGIALSYGSTGGRVQYRDYSGYLRADQLLRYVNLSLPLGYTHSIRENLTVSFDLRPTYTRTMAELKFEEDIQGNYDLNKSRFKSESIAIQPGVVLERRMNKFGVHAQLAYYQTLVKGKLYYEENKDYHLVSNTDEPYYSNWDGVRLSVGVSFLIDN